MERFHVRISNDDLVFSAAHFITIGNRCELLHGHNYRLSAEVFGPLDDDCCVVDFLLLRDVLRAIVKELDHRVLLPSGHPAIRVRSESGEVHAAFGDRRWVFPEADCLQLPLANTTAELLARYLGRRLLDAIAARTGTRPERVRIQLEEGSGFAAVCDLPSE
jgi:6-pyruvoyltetrahydropterin/6-carboxytetrahydropterin synthase